MKRKEDQIKLIATLVISLVLGLVIAGDRLFSGLNSGKKRQEASQPSTQITQSQDEYGSGRATEEDEYSLESDEQSNERASDQEEDSNSRNNSREETEEAPASEEDEVSLARNEEEVPTEEPAPEPTPAPTEEPAAEPTQAPTEEPTAEPTTEPTAEPAEVSDAEPVVEPALIPTLPPAEEPEDDIAQADDTAQTDDAELVSDSRIEAPDDMAEEDDTLSGTSYVPGTVVPVPGHEGLYQNPPVKVEANSFVGKEGKYVGAMATDGIEETSWQFSTETVKLGEVYLDIWLPEGSIVDELWFKNGFWKITEGYDQYTRNGRPKKIGVSFCYDGKDQFADEMQILLTDDKVRADWQIATLGRHDNVCGIRLRIIDIYKGTKFKTDVALSEVMVVQRDDRSAMVTYTPLKHGDKGPEVQRMKERLKELGYFKASADVSDVYNETCEERIKQFQKNNNLPVTGEADSATLSVLYSQSAVGK